MRARRVQSLLMGGQACVFYGAAEFSRDADLVILASPENLDRLREALADLEAEHVAVPPFELAYLLKGHAVHFRCRHPEARGIRVDFMSVLRGVEPFPDLWARRTTLAEPDGTEHDLISLADLVKAKKTQRDKDWPMVRRLLEADYFKHRSAPGEERDRFWLRELRTPELLIEAAAAHPRQREALAAERPLLTLAEPGREAALAEALEAEEKRERELDRRYWQPLKAELERLRRAARG